jgi:hypothetical protein
MRTWFRTFPSTIAALVLGIALLFITALTHIDLVRANLRLLERIERSQADDLAAAVSTPWRQFGAPAAIQSRIS